MKTVLFRAANRGRPQMPVVCTAQPRYPAASARVLHGPEDLAALQPAFQRALHIELGVQAMAPRLCPVSLADGSVAVFALPGVVGSDHADALELRIRQHGYRLATPSRYALAAPLLLEVVRGRTASGGGATMATAAPIALIEAFHEIVDWGVAQGASDIHFNLFRNQPVSEIRFTLAGQYLAPERFRGMSTGMLQEMLSVAWMDINGGNGAVFDPMAEQQGGIVRQRGNATVVLRWSSMAAESGASVCLRLLDRNAGAVGLGLETLGYYPQQAAIIRRAMASEGGAVILSGAVGSGKSTTLASLVAAIPEYRKVVTIEDPIEYHIPRAIQNAVSRDLGCDSHQAYAGKLRSLKRAAPNDVLLGEIRDQETGRAFTDLASAGVGVYTTVHAPSARLVIDRLASRFIDVPRDLLQTPGILKLVLHQVLLPRLCPHCALPADCLPRHGDAARPDWQARHWRHWLDRVQHLSGGGADALRVRNPQGCPHCRNAQVPALNGYAGRLAAAEVLEPSPMGLPSADAGHAWMQDRHAALARCGVCAAILSALRRVGDGQVDARDVEARFLSFDTLEARLAGSGAWRKSDGWRHAC